MRIVRVFDRSTRCGVSIPMYSTVVYLIGELDLSPLDLFSHRQYFKLAWKEHDLDSVRGLYAQLAADLDAHFDTSSTWDGGLTEDRVIEDREYRVRALAYRYASGPYAIELDTLVDPDTAEHPRWLTATVTGLPWGHALSGRIDNTRDPVWGVEGWLDLKLPRAQLEATLARLAAITNLQLT